jgi:bisphosphoglycerate-independent phosphoglycerate mutase (AlkP superfamily)
LEFINSSPGFKGKVAAFTSWDVFPYIINDKRSGIPVSTGVARIEGQQLTEGEKMLNSLILSVPNPLPGVRLDAFTFYYGLEYMKKNKPKVMYFAFDETDDFAHGGEYPAYLNAAHYIDEFFAVLWKYLQSENQYKDKTTLIITSDHGRGSDAEAWKSHGQKIAGADQIWFAVLGPDSAPIGEVKGESQYYQNQLASTLAALLGLQYKGDKIGEVVPSVLKSK